MQPNTGVQNPQDILNAISTLGTQLAGSPPQVSLPTLNLSLPNASDLSSKYNEFLNRAAQDPDIVNYYNQLLQTAKGNTDIAINFLESDYQTGLRNTQADLAANLKNLGLTFTQENQAQQDTLNKRGIALTQDPSGKLTYGGGGQAATEISQAQQGQQLRQEAEQRSASQKVQGLGTTLQKGITSANENLSQTALDASQNKQKDIANRAGSYYDVYQQQQNADTNAKITQQNNYASGSLNPPPYAPNVVNQTVSYNGATWKGNPGSSWSIG